MVVLWQTTDDRETTRMSMAEHCTATVGYNRWLREVIIAFWVCLYFQSNNLTPNEDAHSLQCLRSLIDSLWNCTCRCTGYRRNQARRHHWVSLYYWRFLSPYSSYPAPPQKTPTAPLYLVSWTCALYYLKLPIKAASRIYEPGVRYRPGMKRNCTNCEVLS